MLEDRSKNAEKRYIQQKKETEWAIRGKKRSDHEIVLRKGYFEEPLNGTGEAENVVDEIVDNLEH